MSAKNVSRQQDNRTLARAVVQMEINDLVAIEAVRVARRLKAIVELKRAAGRAKRKSNPIGANSP